MKRLPAVTTGLLRRPPLWRAALASAGVAVALIATLLPREAPAVATPTSLARQIARDAVAVRVPYSWLAAPPPRVIAGDRVDLLGARPGDRGAIAIASSARLVTGDEDALVLELTADDATALMLARAGGYVLLVLVRPAR